MSATTAVLQQDACARGRARRLARRAELLAELQQRYDRGDGCLGVAIDAALKADPDATAEEIAAGLREAEEEARIEREREREEYAVLPNGGAR